MSGPVSSSRERLADLVIERALHGSAPAQDAEMRQLSETLGVWDDGSFERAASAVAVANVRIPLEPMPPALLARLKAAQPPALAAHVQSAAIGGPLPGPSARPARVRTIAVASGWLAAAGCLALAIWALRARPNEPVAVVLPAASVVPAPAAPPRTATAAEARAALLASAKDVVSLPWKPAKDATGATASGDVVWSPSEQRGYMRMKGLATNDPSVAQYQLWILDQGRDAKYPVDGGVFDATTGEVVVPITAKLHVDRPTLFAVTVERPGGVVVSDRKRIAIVASAT